MLDRIRRPRGADPEPESNLGCTRVKLLELVARAGLPALALVLVVHGLMASNAAAALDTRLVPGLLLCGAPWLGGHLLAAWIASRAKRRWAQAAIAGHARDDPAPAFGDLGVGGHSLLLVVLGLLLGAAAHLEGHVSVRVLTESWPPWCAPALAAVAFTAPWCVRRSLARIDLAELTLLVTLGAFAFEGVVSTADGSVVLTLAGLALLLQLGNGPCHLARSPLVVLPLALLGLVTLATFTGADRLAAREAWSWCVAATLLLLAIAVRPRDAEGWRRVLAAPTVVAIAVALSGLAQTVLLAQDFGLWSAWHTRLVVLGRHPNLAAAFLACHTLLAAGLGLSRRGRARVGWLAAAVLLGVTTWQTGSNTGRAALALGIGLLVLLPLLRRAAVGLILAQVRGGRAALVGGAVIVSILAGGSLLASDPGGLMTRSVERFEHSLDFRLDAWGNSARLIADNPWTGIGPGTYLALERFEPGSRFFSQTETPHPHNVFLAVAQAAGLPALLVFVAWMAALLSALVRRLGTTPGAARGEAAGAPSVTLVGGALAASVALLAANLLDLGTSTLTVAPAPLFLLSGLLARREPVPLFPRPGPIILVAAAALVLLTSFGLAPIRAATHLSQAALLAFDAPRFEERLARPGASIRGALERAIALDPTLAEAHLELAGFLERNGDPDAALACLDGLLLLAPARGETHGARGQLLKRLERHEEAVEALAHAVADARGGTHQQRDRADLIWCLTRVGDRAGAHAALVEALTIDSGVTGRLPWSLDAAAGADAAGTAGTAGAAGAGGARGAVAEPVLSLPVSGGAPLRLREALDEVRERSLREEARGRPVGRRGWLHLYAVYRDVGWFEAAREVLTLAEVYVPDLEPETPLAERARMAREQGRTDEAALLLQQAFEISGREHFRNEAAALAGAAPQAPPLDALTRTDEILGRHHVFATFLAVQADVAHAAGRPADAAAHLRRALIFEDDLLARTELWLRIGAARIDAGDADGALEAVAESLAHAAAKPFPDEALLGGQHVVPFAERAARVTQDAFALRGLDDAGAQAAAWTLPGFGGARGAASLFRLAFHARTGQPDRLLREAQLQLLANPDSLSARWAELDALAAFARLEELGRAWNSLLVHVAADDTPYRRWEEYLATAAVRAPDPYVWWRAGALGLLAGACGEAEQLFAGGIPRVDDDLARAELADWSARAAQLDGRPDDARKRLEQSLGWDPRHGLRRLRLSALR